MRQEYTCAPKWLSLPLAAILLAIAIHGLTIASDWPSWRGPNQNGTSTETALPASGEAVLWRVPIGTVTAKHGDLTAMARVRIVPNLPISEDFESYAEGDQARLYAKVWPRDEAEPEQSTLEAVDPQPNLEGSGGIYAYSPLAPVYYDNVKISR